MSTHLVMCTDSFCEFWSSLWSIINDPESFWKAVLEGGNDICAESQNIYLVQNNDL